MKYRYASVMVIATLGVFALVSLIALTTDWFEVPNDGPRWDPDSVSVTLPPPVTTTTTTATLTTTSRPAEATASRGASRTPTMLDRIAACESGTGTPPSHDYRAKNSRSTASGKYQVLDTTWAGYGGYRRSMDAPPAVQEAFALALYEDQGTTPWAASRHCWGASK